MFKSSIRERQWESDWHVWVASRTKLAHTHTSIWLLLLSHWMVSVSCMSVDVSLSLWVREQADTRWMLGNTTEKRDQVMVIESWEATLHSLSRALRARGRRATLPSWDRCPCVCLNTNDRERPMLIVLCYWLYLQLLHIDLIIIIKRTLFFQHNNNNRIFKHQHHQPQHSLTRYLNNHNSTEIEREREQYLCLGWWVVRLSWCCVSTNQPTNNINQARYLIDCLIDWISQSSSNINHV